MAYSPDRDQAIACLNQTRLTLPNTAYLALRRGAFMRGYALSLIHSILPDIPVAKLKRAIEVGNHHADLQAV
ncbi:hypothetical protein [Pseudomonas typographi]|nr:hypothetical protein [Pseudomonas typographi]MBD1586498.1 hypothetical protein [Pseudomonas typographi]